MTKVLTYIQIPHSENGVVQYKITINVLLILQVRDNFFFLREKKTHYGAFSRGFWGALNFLGPILRGQKSLDVFFTNKKEIILNL